MPTPRLVILAAALCAALFTTSPAHALTEAQQDAAIAALQSEVAALQQKTAPITVTTDSTRADKKTSTELTLTGVNLHVVNGSGKTNSTPNGLGNVILGYNEARTGSGAVNTRTGSHNLILGTQNNYSSYSGIVAGVNNSISSGYDSVTGGKNNTASGFYCTVSGGYGNTAGGSYAAVGGGDNNTTAGTYAFLPLDADYSSLNSRLNALQGTTTSQGGSITSLQTAVTKATAITNLFSLSTDSTRSDKKAGTELTLSSVNLHIVNGLGATNGEPGDPFNQKSSNSVVNGLGNLIVGYNESRSGNGGTDARTGSHNIIVGDAQDYTSFGGLVAGDYNTVSGPFASVSGGEFNTAESACSSVSGGSDNVAGGQYSSVSGGSRNTAGGEYSSVSGGFTDTASGADSSVSGGQGVTVSSANGTNALTPQQSAVLGLFSLSTDSTRADGLANTELTLTGVNLHLVNGLGATNGEPGSPYDTSSTVVNGLGNLIVGYNESHRSYDGQADIRTGSHNIIVGDDQDYSSYGGLIAGNLNTISGPYASVTGGTLNGASGQASSVSGGYQSTASGNGASVGGGAFNTASGRYSSVSGGGSNTASGATSWAGGGENNQASGILSSVSGGFDNAASGEYSSVSAGLYNIASGEWSSVSGGGYKTASGSYTFDNADSDYDTWDGNGPTWIAANYSGH